MPRLSTATTTLLAILLLSGCGANVSDSSDESTPPDVDAADAQSTTENSETSTTTPSPDTATPSATDEDLSPRGNLVMNVGEAVTLSTASDGSDPYLTFTVTDIVVDPVCTEPYAEAPEYGHFVEVTIDAETGTPEQFDDAYVTSDLSFNPYDWKFVADNGTTANDLASVATYMCLPESETLPDEIGPGERVTGKLILDVPTPTGILIYQSPTTYNGTEWELPSS